jgi:hypothetical protein
MTRQGYVLVPALVLVATCASLIVGMQVRTVKILRQLREVGDAEKSYSQEMSGLLQTSAPHSSSRITCHSNSSASRLSICELRGTSMTRNPMYGMPWTSSFPLLRWDNVFSNSSPCPVSPRPEMNSGERPLRSQFTCSELLTNSVTGNLKLQTLQIKEHPFVATSGYVEIQTLSLQRSTALIAGGEIHIHRLIGPLKETVTLQLLSVSGDISIGEAVGSISLQLVARGKISIPINSSLSSPTTFPHEVATLPIGIDSVGVR